MPDSQIGFGAADWIEFSIAGLVIVCAFLWSETLRNRIIRFSAKTRYVMLLLFAAPITMRLLLLPHHPVPVPDLYDEFSHLLAADTLLHFRLANPMHPMHRFFETFFVLQKPTYSSIYPLGQGLMLALGRILSGTAWTGVLLSTGAFCAFCYWALRGYVTQPWALLGGLLAIILFGPLNLWMNCYWGGSFPAFAGCLVFGALPRLGKAWRQGTRGRRRDAAILGIGFGLHLLTRPFESLLLALCIVAFVLPVLRRRNTWRPVARASGVALLVLCPVLFVILVQNKLVTGSWTTLPEELSQYQYGVPTTLTFQRPATPHVELTPQQALEYKAQALMHGPDKDTRQRFFMRLEYRVRNYRFFFLPPLYLAAVAFFFSLKRKIYIWVAGALAIFALGTNLFPYLLVHYLAAVTCLFVLVSVAGLQQIRRIRVNGVAAGTEIVRFVVLLCGAQFVLWYGLHLFEGAHPPLALLQYETWDSINHRNPERRIEVANELAAIPGRLLVFVHYEPRHIFQQEWVWNRADIDAARIVFARDLGPEEDEKLIRYYPGRRVLWFEPDQNPSRITGYNEN
jgi:hypothetical protein